MSQELIKNSSTIFFDKILERDRLLKMEFNRLKGYDKIHISLIQLVIKYIDDYTSYHNVSSEVTVEIYKKFIEKYSDNLRVFRKTNQYPYQYEISEEISRVDYDIALILSILFSKVRYLIMHNLHNYFIGKNYELNKVSLVGIGAGIDLEVLCNTKVKTQRIEAYDLNLSPFIKERFSDRCEIIEGRFDNYVDEFDCVVAIELLEHLSEPYEFIKMVSMSLKKEGEFVFTTATDMPQFDHLYNFSLDEELDIKLKACDMKIIDKKDFNHNYWGGPKSSKNTWYVAKRV